MRCYEFHIEPLPAESMDTTIERFERLGLEGWRAVGKFSLNHMLFEREYQAGRRPAQPSPFR